MANLILGPSFEVDSNADGLADECVVTKTVSGTVTTSLVAGLFGSYAQRLQYTSSSDSAKAINFYTGMSAVGAISVGQLLTGSIWMRVTASGISYLSIATNVYNDAGGYVAGQTTSIHYLFPADTWMRIPLLYTSVPAGVSRTRVNIGINGIDTGDSVTLDVDGVYLSPDANFDHYGKYPVIGKGAVLL